MNRFFLLPAALLVTTTLAAADTLYIAHRGASHDKLENTMSAFQEAWKQDADGIECDIHLTRDGKLAVYHDNDTGRLASEKRSLADSTLAELQALKLRDQETIPELRELLADLPDNRLIYIELKSDTPALVPVLAAELAKYHVGPDRARLITFHPRMVETAKELLPQYKCFWLVGLQTDKESGKVKQDAAELIRTARKIGADGLDLSAPDALDAAYLAPIKAAGLELHVWTIDDPATAEKLRKLEFQSITTNRPRFLRDAERGR